MPSGLILGRGPTVQFRRTFEDPETVIGSSGFQARGAYYAMLWSWYLSVSFDRLNGAWREYANSYGLYRNTRALYNPVRRLVDFYAGVVYPGVLSTDGHALPDGIQSAIPLGADTDEFLRAAIGQWQMWANWQSNKSVFVRFGACTGDVMVEVVDDVERGKVTSNIVWPSLVADLTLDAADNVKGYALQYRARHVVDNAEQGIRRGEYYTYRKEVDSKEIRTYMDGDLYGYDGVKAKYPNPYGFVPAVWVKHTNLGTDHGLGVVRGLVKLDEVNSLASHVHDQIHRSVAAPMIFWTDGAIANLFSRKKATDPEAVDVPEADKETLLMLKGPEGGRKESLLGDVQLAAALPYIQELLTEIEHDHPELSMYSQLRAMSTVTGPGAERLIGDVASLVYEAQASYDQQYKKLAQMSVAIGGWRAKSGAWGRVEKLNSQQRKFLPFDLDSYTKGDLDFDIVPRPLVPQTAAERLAGQQAQMQLEADRIGLQVGAAQANAALAGVAGGPDESGGNPQGAPSTTPTPQPGSSPSTSGIPVTAGSGPGGLGTGMGADSVTVQP